MQLVATLVRLLIAGNQSLGLASRFRWALARRAFGQPNPAHREPGIFSDHLLHHSEKAGQR